MKKIELIQRRFYIKQLFALVDDEDYMWLMRFNWYAVTARSKTYAGVIIDGTRILMHQLILPSPSPEYTPDHKDRNGLNNQRNNLRLATYSQQKQNNEKYNLLSTSKYKGVNWYKSSNKWVAKISVNSKRIHLGYFESEVAAAEAYNTAALKYFKEFAVLNEVERVN